MQFNFKILVMLLMTIAATSCNGKPSASDIQNLMLRSIDNLVYVEGGSFMMGDSGGEYTDKNGDVHKQSLWTGDRDTKPAHKVTLDTYYMQKYEVTFAEYDVFTSTTNRPLHRQKFLGKPLRGPTVPVGALSWYDAKAYCQWLGEHTGLPFDLPTEAQWEFAARSRTLNVPFATDTGGLDKGRNYGKYLGDTILNLTPVGSHPPNPLGLYDMTRNADEWTNDWYAEDYYHDSPEHNPTGPATGEKKVLRGGSNLGTAAYDALYRRLPDLPNEGTYSYAGMRCVLNLKEKLSVDEIKKRIKAPAK